MLAMGLTVNPISAENPKLTVWIRAGGPAVKSEISSFVQNVLESLPQNVPSQVLVCTNKDDTILEELDTITKTYKTVKVIFSQLSSYSSALNTLALNTDSESNVLTVTVGVNIRKDQIQTGLNELTGSVKVYGWLVKGHENDGSCPGKGWYNTAALIHKTIVQQMKEGIPNWIDNGILGKIDNHIIGGNEEITIMVKALQRDPETKFILNISDPVSSSLRLGIGITFQEKLERKTVVSKYYMQKLHQEQITETDFATWQKIIWASLKVI